MHTSISTSIQTAVVTRGYPQEEVLSPPVWCLVINEFLIMLEMIGVYAWAHVDNLAIIDSWQIRAGYVLSYAVVRKYHRNIVNKGRIVG